MKIRYLAAGAAVLTASACGSGTVHTHHVSAHGRPAAAPVAPAERAAAPVTSSHSAAAIARASCDTRSRGTGTRNMRTEKDAPPLAKQRARLEDRLRALLEDDDKSS